MALVLNEEQRMLQTSAQEFFASDLPIRQFREARDKMGAVRISEDAWQAMVELGWSSILVPESLGGLEFGLTGMGVICIEAARHLAATPLQSSATLGVETLLRCEESDSRNALLSSMASGDLTLAVVSGDNDTLQLQATDEGFSLTGVLDFVPEGMTADKIILLPACNSISDSSMKNPIVMDAQMSGLTRQSVDLIDRRDYARLQFDNVQIDDADSYSFVGDAPKCVERLSAIGAVMTACELYGGSHEAFTRTIAHLSEREQFGQKLGSFQALQHRMAKAYMQLELLKSVLYDALSAIEDNRPDAALAVSHAKVMANDVAQLACTEAIQMHGGMGITDELDIGLFYKRSRVLRSVFGSSAEHKKRFAQLSGL